MIRITIRTDTDAFKDPYGKPDRASYTKEVRRVLLELLECLKVSQESGSRVVCTTLFDSLGNNVGDYEDDANL